MKIWSLAIIVATVVVLLGCGADNQVPESIKATYSAQVMLRVYNPLDIPVADAPVRIGLDELRKVDPAFNEMAWVAYAGGKELPGQLLRAAMSGGSEILLILSMEAGQSQEVHLFYAPGDTIEREYKKRTHAELAHKFGGRFIRNEKGKMVYEGGAFRNVKQLRVPPEHTDHTFFVRYEGPGWESDKVGYRFYLDWRNATDIFGKKVPEPVLQNVGQDGFDSYHEMGDWGMDILKVGDALGVGAVGYWDGSEVRRVSETDSVICTITADGPEFSQVATQYFGWRAGTEKTDLTSHLSILAGDRKTHHEVMTEPALEGLCTGIVKHEGVRVLRSAENTSGWGYIGTYGLQSLAGDSLGMAVIFRTADLEEITEDKLNHVVVLNAPDGKCDFYFLAAWEQEPGGIRSGEQFEKYLAREILKLGSPLEVDLMD